MLATRKPTPKSNSSLGASQANQGIRASELIGQIAVLDLPCRLRGGHFSGQQRIEAAPATRFIHPLRTEQHTVLAGHEALRVIGRIAAYHADGVGLGDVFS